ncbi:hypothetical protein AAC387_Pa12g1509 [Persea americana]
MNRGVKLTKKSPHQKGEMKEKPNPRNPLKELNTGSCSTSIETPRGCFRFLLSNPSSKTTAPRSKTLLKTPKSAPNARNLHTAPSNSNARSSNPRSKLPKKNTPKSNLENLSEPRSQNPHKPRGSYLAQWQNGKRSIFGGHFLERDPQSKLEKQQSLVRTDTGITPHLMEFVEDGVSEKKLESGICLVDTQNKDLEGQYATQPSDLSFGPVSQMNSTPVSELSSRSCLVVTPDKAFEEHFTTPPLQASISPKFGSVNPSELRWRPQFDTTGTPSNKLSSGFCLVSVPGKASELQPTTPPDLSFGSVLEMFGTPASKLSSGSYLVSASDKALEEHSAIPPCMASVSPMFYSVKSSKIPFTPELDNNNTPSNKLSSGFCLGLEQHSTTPSNLGFRSALEMNTTPMNKSTSGTCLVSTPDTTSTPPIQASISPEIIGESSLISTPACFAAGHVIVGVSDKRKCRPRGILTVGDEVYDTTLCNSRASLVPAPAEAAMHWLLSPTNNANNSDVERSPEFEGLPGATTSPESVLGFSGSLVPSPTVAKMGTVDIHSPSPEFGGLMGPATPVSNATTSSGHMSIASPCSGILEVVAAASFQSKAPIPQKEKGYRYDHLVENSPLSIDSWGSGNVICTPESNSNSDRRAGFSKLNMEDFLEHQLNLNTMVGDLQAVSLSPKSHVVNCDPVDFSSMPHVISPFTYPATPSNSIDVTHALKQFHGQTYKTKEFCRWEAMSSSNFESMSQMRISWREGLISRIFEMDELDCCRWSSEEDDVNCCRDEQVKSDSGLEFDQNVTCSTLIDQNDSPLAAGFGSPEFICDEQGNEKGKRIIPAVGLTTYAESISTEGGGLVASGDSDWTVFYKNQLFEV